MSLQDSLAAVPDEGVPLPKKPVYSDAHFDITAMIDLVFMMNIFFLVTSIASSLSEVDLPKAQHVKGADPEKCVVVTLILEEEGKPPKAFLGEGQSTPLPDGKEQENLVRAELEAGKEAGKNVLLIKAEKGVLHRDVARIASVAAGVEGAKLNLAVIEYDE